MRTNEKAPEKGVIRKIKKKSTENEQKEYDGAHPADKAEPGWFTDDWLYSFPVGICFPLLLLPEGWSQSHGRVQWLETTKLGSKLLHTHPQKRAYGNPPSLPPPMKLVNKGNDMAAT